MVRPGVLLCTLHQLWICFPVPTCIAVGPREHMRV